VFSRHMLKVCLFGCCICFTHTLHACLSGCSVWLQWFSSIFKCFFKCFKSMFQVFCLHSYVYCNYCIWPSAFIGMLQLLYLMFQKQISCCISPPRPLLHRLSMSSSRRQQGIQTTPGPGPSQSEVPPLPLLLLGRHGPRVERVKRSVVYGCLDVRALALPLPLGRKHICSSCVLVTGCLYRFTTELSGVIKR